MAYQDYKPGQHAQARVIEIREHEVGVVLVDDDTPGVIPEARPINFGVTPPRYMLPGDRLTLDVVRLDPDRQVVILALGENYAARAQSADMALVAFETRRVIYKIMNPMGDKDEEEDDLFFDFDSRRRVSGSHSEPIMLEEDFDNPGETLYQLIDELGDDEDDAEDEDDEDDSN